MIRRLPPYFVNLGKRLVKSPKIYVRDTGLLHHLLRIQQFEQLQGHPSIGASWEGYVIEQIIREAAEFSDFYYYRTKDGAEVDFAFSEAGVLKQLIECKWGDNKPHRALVSFAAQFPDTDAVQIVYNLRQEEFRNRIRIVDAATWLAQLAA